MYQLYFKEHQDLKIKKLEKVFEHQRDDIQNKINESGKEWYQYNNCYIFANDRKALKTLAQQMKDKWIEDLSNRLVKVNSIKV